MLNEIYDAIVEGNLDQVNKLISKNPSCLKIRYPQNNNKLPDLLPIEIAARYGQLKVFALLVEKGSLFTEKDKNGKTLMHYAARGGNIQIMQAVNQRDISYEVKTNNGLTPMHYAAAAGQIKGMQFLHDTGKVSYEIKANDGKSPMHSAACWGQIKSMEFLHDTGKVPYDIKDNDGITAMHYAAGGGEIKSMEFLHDTGKVPYDIKDNVGITPMHCAAGGGEIKSMEFLHDTGKVPYDIKDNVGITPMHRAAIFSDMKTVRFLLINGIYLEEKSKSGKTALQYAEKNKNEKTISFIKNAQELLARTLQSLKDKACQFTLIAAEKKLNSAETKEFEAKITQDFEEIIKKEDAELAINIRDEDGNTLLHLMVRYIIELEENDQSTKIEMDAIKVLLKQGANLHACNRENKLPIDFAENHHELKNLLIPPYEKFLKVAVFAKERLPFFRSIINGQKTIPHGLIFSTTNEKIEIQPENLRNWVLAQLDKIRSLYDENPKLLYPRTAKKFRALSNLQNQAEDMAEFKIEPIYFSESEIRNLPAILKPLAERENFLKLFPNNFKERWSENTNAAFFKPQKYTQSLIKEEKKQDISKKEKEMLTTIISTPNL